jgi:NAD(P)-dependent dehydrogenase (short-subunit alcohol dehydrogenase family)
MVLTRVRAAYRQFHGAGCRLPGRAWRSFGRWNRACAPLRTRVHGVLVEFTHSVVVVTGAVRGSARGWRAPLAPVARGPLSSPTAMATRPRVAADVGGASACLDVREPDALAALVDEVEERHDPIRLFCSNAGILGQGGVEDTDERLGALWDVHVLSHIRAARAVLPRMIARGAGYLLNIASAAGLLAQIGSLGYTVTKAADIALSGWLAITHWHQGIRVSVLCPQSVRSNLLANSPVAADSLDALKNVVMSPQLEPDAVGELCFDAMRDERFLILPNPEVEQYARRKHEDIDR